MKDLFYSKKAEIEKKYAANLVAFEKATGLDQSCCFEMLVCNARCFANGATDAVIPGGGKVNTAELVADVLELDKYRQ